MHIIISGLNIGNFWTKLHSLPWNISSQLAIWYLCMSCQQTRPWKKADLSHVANLECYLYVCSYPMFDAVQKLQLCVQSNNKANKLCIEIPSIPVFSYQLVSQSIMCPGPSSCMFASDFTMRQLIGRNFTFAKQSRLLYLQKSTTLLSEP